MATAAVVTHERLQARAMEPDLEVHEDEFTYWQQQGRGGQKGRR